MSSESEVTGYTIDEINLVEAVLFSASKPLSTHELKKLIKSRHKGGIKGIVEQLNRRYVENAISFRIREIAGGFQFYLPVKYSVQVEKYFSKQRTRKLSPAGLETLAIVAYRQPITKGEIEHIRGVSSDGVLQTLLERTLIKPAGRAERVGRPLLYATTSAFLDYFGINSLDELPKLEEVMQKPSLPSSQATLDLNNAESSTSNPQNNETENTG